MTPRAGHVTGLAIIAGLIFVVSIVYSLWHIQQLI